MVKLVETVTTDIETNSSVVDLEGKEQKSFNRYL